MSESSNPYQPTSNPNTNPINESDSEDSSALFPNILHVLIGGMTGLGSWGLFLALKQGNLITFSVPLLWFLFVGIVAGLAGIRTSGILALILVYTSVPLFFKSKLFPLDAIFAFFTVSISVLVWLPIYLTRSARKKSDRS
nr:hypothetical protein [Pirellula sp.]